MSKQDKVYPSVKTSAISGIKDLVSRAKSIGVIDYTGLKVSQATELRKAVRSTGGELKITKNTLFRLAMGKPELPLSGLSAFVFGLTDEISTLKAILDFSKKHNLLSFKLGFMGDKQLSAEETSALAATPSRETSISKLLYLLNFNTSKLAATLDAIAKKEVN